MSGSRFARRIGTVAFGVLVSLYLLPLVPAGAAVTPSSVPPVYTITPPAVGVAATPDGNGYWETTANGSLYSFGGASYYGSLSALPASVQPGSPVVAMTVTPDGKGYWQVTADGDVYSFGDANFYGSMGGTQLNQPIVGMAASPNGGGYWLVAADGGIFSFGNAAFFGSLPGSPPIPCPATAPNCGPQLPVVAMAATPDGGGYWITTATGQVFPFGDAQPFGSAGNLDKPITGMAATPDGKGYWLVASDGGIFSFGDAHFYGSMGGVSLNAPVVGMAAAPNDSGYWLVGSDGGIFSFGAAHFYGAGQPPPTTPPPTATRIITYQPFSANGTMDPALQVTNSVSGTCQSAGVAGNSSYRCFEQQPSGAIYDPCFAKPGATSGPLLCPENPASPSVVQFQVGSLPPDLEGSPQQRPWAVELSNGQVCVLVNAAWGGLGPFGCQPTPPGPLADCHVPVQGAPWWTAACQDQESNTSPFTTYQVDTIWI